MKQIFLCIAILFTVFVARAQKEVHIDLDQMNVAYSYPPLIKEFTKSTTYKVLMPTSLNYHAGAEVEGLFSPYSLQLNGKLYQPKMETEYTIIVKTLGLTAIENKGDRMWEKKISGQPSVNGYLRDYQVYFPCTMTIIKGTDTMLRIQVYGKNTPIDITFDKGMVQPSLRTASYPNEIFQFSSPAEIERLGPQAISKMLERAASWQVMAQIKAVAEDLFSNMPKETDMGMFGIIKKKKREFVFDDIDAAVEKYKTSITAIKAGNQLQADTMLISTKEMFNNLLNPHEQRIDKNVQEVLQYNILLCSFWLKQYKETAQRLEQFKQTALAKWNGYSFTSLEYRLKKADRRFKLMSSNIVVLN